MNRIKNYRKRSIGILVVLLFVLNFSITPALLFSNYNFGSGFENPTDEEQNPNLSTNYLFKGTSYVFNLDDFYDDANLYKAYTGAKFQTEAFNGTSLEWSGVVNNDTVTPVNNTICKSPSNTGVTMINGTFDNTDNMKANDGSYTNFTSTLPESFYESPAQWGDFSFTKGAGNTVGELETDNDVNYAIIDAEVIYSGESLLGVIVPADSDIITDWDNGAAPPHWSLLDEAPGDMDGDGGQIVENAIGVHDRWNFDTLVIGAGHVVTKLVFNGYVRRDGAGGTISFTTSVGASGIWAVSFGAFGWSDDTETGLDFGQTELDDFWMDVELPDVCLVSIETVYIDVYTSLKQYSADYTITWDVDDPDLVSIDKFRYDYRTTVAIDCDLDIYNWDTTGWLELESNTVDTYITGSYALTDPYINASDYVKIRFQTAGNGADFDMELDQVVLDYWNNSTELEMTITFPFANYNEDLLAMTVQSWQRTNISQTITFKIWNYDTESYVQISSSSDISFTKKEYNTTSPTDFISPSGVVKLYWIGSNTTNNFELHIDYLFIQIYYKLDLVHEKSFDTNGIYRYRWCVLGSIHYTDWVVFEVVDPVPNFHAISESEVTTRWILQGADISPVENFTDDISGVNWYLYGSEEYMSITRVPTDDAVVISWLGDANFGDVINLDVDWIWNDLIEEWIETWTYIKYEVPYLTDSCSDNSYFRAYFHNVISSPDVKVYNTTDFDEMTITWNNKPASTGYITTTNLPGTGWRIINLNNVYDYYFLNVSAQNDQGVFYSSEHTNQPTITHNISKNYQGSGYMYMQTNTTETIALKSTVYGSNYTLSSGDYFEVDFQTSSDSQINLILLRDGVVNKTLTLSPSGNTNFNRHTVQVSVSEDVEFDQLKISSTFEDEDYVRIYDIKTKKYTLTGDSADFYVGSRRTEDVYLTPDTYNLRIFEEGDEKIDTNITIGSSDYYYVYTPTANLQCRLTLFSTEGDFLNFEDYHITVNRSLNGEYNEFSLLDNLFYAGVETYVYIDVYDRFDSLIGSFERLASSYIDLEIEVYSLQIKNLQTQKTTVDINTTHVYPLLSEESIYFMLSKNYYQIGYYDTNNVYKQFLIYLDSNQAYELNRSKICFLAYVNQKGEHLYFDDYKTYINDSLIYENVFYREIGDDIGIEVKDLYGISIKNQTYTVVSGDNYIPVVLTMYSLKVMSQQLCFNHINITRDPNYYESSYYWSEWIAPSEIIDFRLFAGYYKINLTNNEAESSSYYSYTLSGDDILLIGSNNTIYNVLINIANVNMTIGNQITNVQIDLTNQNSNINNSIINVDINLGNINSTLGNMLVNLDVDITNIANNISTLYVFTNNSFINLNNVMNTSFIYMENNIISINQSISNLVIGISNDIYLINGTISTMISQLETNLLLMNVSIDTALFDLGTTLDLIGSNITNNYILLNNSITLTNTNINDSRIAIINNLLLVNNTISTLISEVYSAVYLINNSIYTAVVDLGTYLSLMNNTISGNLSIVLQMNDFLTELYQMTMFSDLLNWADIGLNTSLLTSQIDAWTFVNNYINQSIEVHLRYQDLIEKLVISADDSIEQYLPNKDVEYNLWSILDGEYLDEWEELDPKNKTVSFGFYEEEIPFDPEPIRNSFNNALILIIFGVGIFLILVGIVLYIQKKNRELQERDKYFNRKLDPTSFSRSMTD